MLTFQIFIVLSWETLANEQSGSSAREVTQQVWPVNVKIDKPLFTFQILIVSSLEPLANVPSWSTAREETE